MAGLGDFFSEGSTAEQFLIWGVLQQILQPLLQPLTVELSKLVYSATPDVPLPAELVAQATARKIIDDGTGRDAANDTGIGGSDFEKLVSLALRAPDISTVFEAFRRNLIEQGNPNPDDVSVAGALTDMGIRPEWHPIITQLAVSIPTAAEVLNAWLEGQIEPAEAHRRLIEAGMDPTWIQTAYNANGQAPTPTQALELLNRGIIPERGTGPSSISYEQAFLEGPWRNKWLQPFLALAEYLPPPRTVTAMYHAGQLTHDQAASLLAKQGLAPELVQAYLSKASSAHTTTDKHLAKSEITALYQDRLMGHGDALAALQAIGYDAHDAGLILQLIDVRRAAAAATAGVTRIHTLFEAGKLTEPQAKAALVKLDVPADQAQQVIDAWAVTVQQATRTLSPAQIETAWYYEILRTEDALTLLQRAGYDEFDAWVLLSARGHGPLRDVPRPASPYPPPPPPTPGKP